MIQEALLASLLGFAVGLRTLPRWLPGEGIPYVLTHLDEDAFEDNTGQAALGQAMSVGFYNILDTWQFFKRGCWTRCYGQSILAHYPSLRRNLRTFNVSRALEAVRTFGSTNPRDRIYSVGALFDIGLEVNYQAAVE